MALKFLNNGYFAGKVGIGIESPTTQLHLKRTSGDVRGVMVETTVTTSFAEVQLKADREFRIGTGGSGSGANSAGVFYVYDATAGGAAGHRFEISSAGDVQARRVRSNTAGEVALSLQPTDSTIHYGFRIDQTTNSFNLDRVDSAGTFMTVSPTGKVGIGTTNPTQNLHLDGNNYNTATRTTFLIRDVGNNYDQGDNAIDIVMRSRYWSGDQNTSQNSKIRHLKDNSNGSTGTQLRFGTTTRGAGDSSDKMTILASGNVGIGTTSPSAKFVVADGMSGTNSQTGLEFIPQDSSNRNIIFSYDRSSSAYRELNFDASNFKFNPGGSTQMVINSSGDVGINTTLPFEKLQTNGNIYAENRIISADATNANQNLLTQADIKISNQTDIYGNLTKVIISPYEAAYTSDGTGSSTIRLDSETAMTPGAIHTFSVYYKDLVGSLGIDLYDVAASGSYTSAIGTAAAPASGRLYGYAQKASTGAGAGYNFVDINLTNNGSVTLLNPKLETGKVVTEFIATTEDEGIPQTITTNNLRATGSIQMGADDTTATADKAGTMRYRSGTEYVEVTGVDLVTNGDFATDSNWTKETGWSIGSNVASYNGSANNNAIYQSPGLTSGSTYRLSFSVVNYVSGTLIGNLSSGSTTGGTGNITANGDYSFNITAAGVLCIFRSTSSFNGSIDNVSVIEVTSEDASYADMCMQTGASTYEWVNIVRNTY